jgi:hypothetical protein
MYRFTLCLFSFIIVNVGYSQDIDSHSDHDHEHTNEIGIGVGLVNTLGEEGQGFGFHLHYLRAFGEKQRFSLAPGFEGIFDEHRHYAFNLSLGYRPWHPFYIAIAPGIAIDDEGHSEFITHFEILYEFEFQQFHIGPMIEFGIAKDEQHIMTALHAGYSF